MSRLLKSLGLALAATPRSWEVSQKGIVEATGAPPRNTRAAIRSEAMHHLKDEERSYYIDWEIVGAEGRSSLHLLNPFESGSKETEHWLRLLSEPALRS